MSSLNTTSIWDGRRKGFFQDLSSKSIVHAKKWALDYLKPTISGTRTPWIIDSDIDGMVFTRFKEAYYTISYFEHKYKESSADAYDKWKNGEISSQDYSDWISAYLKVWDKIKYDSKS